MGLLAPPLFKDSETPAWLGLSKAIFGFPGCAAYAFICAANGVGCAPYAIGCAAHVVGCAVFMCSVRIKLTQSS